MIRSQKDRKSVSRTREKEEFLKDFSAVDRCCCRAFKHFCFRVLKKHVESLDRRSILQGLFMWTFLRKKQKNFSREISSTCCCLSVKWFNTQNFSGFTFNDVQTSEIVMQRGRFIRSAVWREWRILNTWVSRCAVEFEIKEKKSSFFNFFLRVLNKETLSHRHG